MKNSGLCLLLISLVFATSIPQVKAQKVSHQTEAWLGYITSYQLNKKWSVWNDWHFIPNSFFVTRHGLTYKTSKKSTLTAGYAWVVTATSFSDKLIRKEHRPWGQWENIVKLSPRLSYRFRFRFDYRIRQQITNNQLQNTHIANCRWRILNDLRYSIKETENKNAWQLALMNETLYNTGKEINNGLDQNRSYLMLVYRQSNITFLGGYSLRTIPNSNNTWLANHGITVWVVHRLGNKD